jgi:hypothetical protein
MFAIFRRLHGGGDFNPGGGGGGLGGLTCYVDGVASGCGGIFASIGEFGLLAATSMTWEPSPCAKVGDCGNLPTGQWVSNFGNVDFLFFLGADGAGSGGGDGGGNAAAQIKQGIDKARFLLSDPDCAKFLKNILVQSGITPNLDSFLKNFDSTTIIPNPPGEAPSPLYTVHVHGIGQVNTIHVDHPGNADLAPSLLHDEFHTINYGISDAGLAQYTTGSHVSVGPGVTQAQADFQNSRAASRAFDKNCDPTKVH